MADNKIPDKEAPRSEEAEEPQRKPVKHTEAYRRDWVKNVNIHNRGTDGFLDYNPDNSRAIANPWYETDSHDLDWEVWQIHGYDTSSLYGFRNVKNKGWLVYGGEGRRSQLGVMPGNDWGPDGNGWAMWELNGWMDEDGGSLELFGDGDVVDVKNNGTGWRTPVTIHEPWPTDPVQKWRFETV